MSDQEYLISSENQKPKHRTTLANRNNGKMILAFEIDGSIAIGPGYTPSEAGEEFLKALEEKGIHIRRVKRIQNAIDGLNGVLKAYWYGTAMPKEDREQLESTIALLEKLKVEKELGVTGE